MPEKDNNRITVSIVTGRCFEHLARCLGSLPVAAHRIPLEVYVIDNLSEFDVTEAVQQSYPSAKIIKNTKRQGFGANHNQVLKKCQTEYALVLNDDIELGQDCIDKLLKFMESHTEAGSVGPALYEKSWQGEVQTAGGTLRSILPFPIKTILYHILRLLGLTKSSNQLRGHKKVAQSETPVELSFISGCCCMLRRQMLDKIGFYDENFYMYLEDIDLGQKALKADWKCYQVPGARIIHYETASFSSRTYNWIINGAIYYTRKYHSILTRWLTYLPAGLLRILAGIKTGSSQLRPDLPFRKIPTPKSILVMKLGGLGDVLMITPALKALRTRFPKAHVSLMAEEPGIEVVRHSPYVDELLTFTEFYTHKSYTRLLNLAFLSRGYKLIKTLLNRHFDIFISFQGLFNRKGILKPMLIGYLSRAPIRLGLDTENRGYFLNMKIPDTRLAPKSMVNRTLNVVKKLGAEVKDPSTQVWISEEDRSYAKGFLAQHSIKPHDLLIGIHPGGNPQYLTRCSWPEERFSQVADILSEKYQAKILLTGGSQEITHVNKIISLMKTRPLLLVGATTVKQLAAVIEKCHLFISNDTGPMHMAVAMKVPTIGIFGPGDWPAYGTYPPESNFIMLRKPIHCWPCQDLTCTTRECISLINMENVLDAVEKQIKKRR